MGGRMTPIVGQGQRREVLGICVHGCAPAMCLAWDVCGWLQTLLKVPCRGFKTVKHAKPYHPPSSETHTPQLHMPDQPRHSC